MKKRKGHKTTSEKQIRAKLKHVKGKVRLHGVGVDFWFHF